MGSLEGKAGPNPFPLMLSWVERPWMYHYTSTMAKYVVLTVTHSLHLAATLSSQHLLWEQWNLCEIIPIEVTCCCNHFDLTLAWRPLRDARGLLWWWRWNTQRVAFLREGNYPFSACWVQKPNGFVAVLLGWTIFLDRTIAATGISRHTRATSAYHCIIINHEVSRKLSYDDIIDNFPKIQSRSVQFCNINHPSNRPAVIA